MPCDDDNDVDDGDDRECVQSMTLVVVYRHSDTNPNSHRDDKEDKHWLASDIQILEETGTRLIDLPQIQKQIHFFLRADLAFLTAPSRC